MPKLWPPLGSCGAPMSHRHWASRCRSSSRRASRSARRIAERRHDQRLAGRERQRELSGIDVRVACRTAGRSVSIGSPPSICPPRKLVRRIGPNAPKNQSLSLTIGPPSEPPTS